MSVLSRLLRWTPIRSRICLPSSRMSVSAFSSGRQNSWLKFFALSRCPGATKSVMHHRSISEFSTGVPVSARRKPVFSAFNAFVTSVPGVLIRCASSMTTVAHGIKPKSNWKSRTVSYVVSTNLVLRRRSTSSAPRRFRNSRNRSAPSMSGMWCFGTAEGGTRKFCSSFP